ncbi:hypothetical protein DFA_00446 [Cavenderia fasciculata]|uniref:Transmembrane protein n=1 Tax=Cavenderia fasciculata TaxID=261658 RepID=F4PRY7_CACFS|nr:uncharacterized protein DFA_00446 [Cavenderia fasciculata]EGG20585.1 hypothetical protein DFA_00446 [Cavenderia fasciculata]|eukprot:XP_004358435.1 hypothetical protein DFA_00446 [Cavenderia fasciculata]
MMKSYTTTSLLFIVYLLSIFVNVNNGQIFFNTSSVCTQAAPCQWNDPTIWIPNGIPTSSSAEIDVVIDGNSTNIIYIVASTVFEIHNLNVQFTVLSIEAGATFDGAFTAEDSDISIANNPVTVDSINTTNGTLTLLTGSMLSVSNIALFYATQFVASDNSSALFNGNATFQALPPPLFQDASELTCLSECTFHAGVTVNSTGHTGLTNVYLYMTSQFGDVTLVGEMVIVPEATANIQGSFYGSAQSFVSVSTLALLLINGQPQTVTFNQLQVNEQGTVQIVNVANDVTGATSYIAGTVLFDNCLGTTSFGQTTAFANLQVAGVIGELILNAANIGNLTQVQSQVPNAQPNVRISSVGDVTLNTFGSLLINTIFDVEQGGSLLLNDDVEFAGPGGFRVYGEFTINQATITTENDPDYPAVIGITLYGGVLYTENTTIDGVVRIADGTWFPVDTTIVGNVNFQGGYLNFSTATNQNLNISGSLTIGEGATIYLNNDLIAEDDPIVFVSGNVTLGGTIVAIMQDPFSLVYNKNYFIIESETSIDGIFISSSVVTSFVSSFEYEFELSPGGNYFLQLVFTEPPVPSGGPTGHMAGWKVFLIILSILVVLGGGIYGFLRYKRNSGYLPVH